MDQTLCASLQSTQCIYLSPYSGTAGTAKYAVYVSVAVLIACKVHSLCICRRNHSLQSTQYMYLSLYSQLAKYTVYVSVTVLSTCKVHNICIYRYTHSLRSTQASN